MGRIAYRYGMDRSGMDRCAGKVISPDCYKEQIAMWTQDFFTRSHLSCRIPDRFVLSHAASRIIGVGTGSRPLQHGTVTRALQEQDQDRCSVQESYRNSTGALQRQDQERRIIQERLGSVAEAGSGA